MWLSDYLEAIQAVLDAIGDHCWTSITGSWDGTMVIFKTDLEWYYVYYRYSGRIERRFTNVWGRRDVLVEGN